MLYWWGWGPLSCGEQGRLETRLQIEIKACSVLLTCGRDRDREWSYSLSRTPCPAHIHSHSTQSPTFRLTPCICKLRGSGSFPPLPAPMPLVQLSMVPNHSWSQFEQLEQKDQSRHPPFASTSCMAPDSPALCQGLHGPYLLFTTWPHYSNVFWLLLFHYLLP